MESIYCTNQKSLKKTELARTLNQCKCPQDNGRQQKKSVIEGIRNKRKKEEQEVQNYPNKH